MRTEFLNPSRRHIIYGEMTRWGKQLSQTKVAQKTKSFMMVNVLKDGVIKKVDISTLSKDSFTKTGKFNPPLIII